MDCQIIKINQKKPEKEILQKAAEIIKRGGLVAFTTETVYGLGASALNKKAVRKIFKVKGRPLDNPVIVHIADFQDLSKLAKEIPETAKILAKKFWPGPLTLVLFKKKIVPDEVTAGSNTVAIRMPKNKIALELIRTAKVPIAAPSANLAGRPSPTTAQHVFDDLGGPPPFRRKRWGVDLILDGGPTKIGVESTVIDLTVKPPQVLRPGGTSFEELKKVLKDIKFHPFLLGKKLKDKIVKSPGMKYRHYAPEASLILIKGGLRKRVKKFKNLISFYRKQKKTVGVMISQETQKFLKDGGLTLIVGSRRNLKEVSRNLFKTLRKFDSPLHQKFGGGNKKKIDPPPFRRKRWGVDVILVETFPEKGIGFAIMHRLKKAAASHLQKNE